jgi:hypothetical protein
MILCLCEGVRPKQPPIELEIASGRLAMALTVDKINRPSQLRWAIGFLLGLTS